MITPDKGKNIVQKKKRKGLGRDVEKLKIVIFEILLKFLTEEIRLRRRNVR